MIVSFDATTTISTVSDSKGNTWSLLGAVTTQGGAKVAVYYALNWAGGTSHTGSMTFSASAFPTLHMLEVTGAATTSPFNVDITEIETATPFSITSGALAQAAELIIMIGEQNAAGNDADQYTSTALTILSSEPALTSFWTSGIATGIVASTSSANYDITKGTPTTVAGLSRLITVKEAGAAPTINTQPQSVNVYTRETANFTVAATASAGALHYQWKVNGSNVGTDSSSYARVSVVDSDIGAQVTCSVSDDNGTIVSNAATLTVLAAATMAWLAA